MAKITVWVLSCLLLVTLFNNVVALKCYNCVKCNDPFKKDGVSTTDCSGVCMKVKLTSDGIGGVKKGDVVRSCLPVQMESTCKESEQGGYKGEVCTCNSELCNGSDVTKVTIATGIMTAIVILKNIL